MDKDEINTRPGTIEYYKPEYWALVELMGHNRMVGRVTAFDELGDGTLLRVDALDENGQLAFSRILSPAAIYAINPCSQEVAVTLARDGLNRGASPILAFSLPTLKAKIREDIEREKLIERENDPEVYYASQEEDDDEPL
jgi:hypothetical protein